MAFSGLNETGGTNTAVEFYTARRFEPAVHGSLDADLYPRMHLLPNGQVFYSDGPQA